MQAQPTSIPDVVLLEPDVFGDERGFFFESFNARSFRSLTGADVEFVQDNHSMSRRDVLRGLHYQQPAQGKLVRAIVGTIFDVAVDIRRGSATFGQWVGAELSADNKRQLWVPAGFAHGFLVRSEVAEFMYKVTTYYEPRSEYSIAWNDPDLAIEWPLGGHPPILSERDRSAVPFRDAQLFD